MTKWGAYSLRTVCGNPADTSTVGRLYGFTAEFSTGFPNSSSGCSMEAVFFLTISVVLTKDSNGAAEESLSRFATSEAVISRTSISTTTWCIG